MTNVAFWASALALLAVVSAGCVSQGTPVSSPVTPVSSPVSAQAKQVTGLVTEVRGLPFRVPEYLAVRDDEGRKWQFTIDASMVTMITSHLKEDHMNLRQPVTVYYRETPEGLVAIMVTDILATPPPR